MSNNNVAHRKYKKDFLTSVIVRIDFDTPLPIATNGPAQSIYGAVKERFPITEEKRILGKQLFVGPGVTKERSVESTEWHYYGKNREKHLTISPNTMLIDYDKYEYYEMLRDDFLSVSDAIFVAYLKLQVKRASCKTPKTSEFLSHSRLKFESVPSSSLVKYGCDLNQQNHGHRPRSYEPGTG